ncbi:hypothetical protein GC174_15200 [bacterium]|nr:hypothetical protein [bacterium]
MKRSVLIAHLDRAHLLVPSAFNQGYVPLDKVICVGRELSCQDCSKEDAATAFTACGITHDYLPDQFERQSSW